MIMIEISNLYKNYGKQSVLKDINLQFTGGQSVALIGPNGSGKTTLIKAILNLVIPEKGKILVDNQDVVGSPKYREIIGYMPQLSRFPEQMKVNQLFTLIKNIRGQKTNGDYDTSLYDQYSISKMANKPLGNLSGGMKQQVSAALAFYFKPKIVILDEPTAGMDPLSNEILKSKINNAISENKLVITTSHILNDLDEICNHVIYLLDGEVLFNKTIQDIKDLTGESKLNKMVVSLLQKNQHDEED